MSKAISRLVRRRLALALARRGRHEKCGGRRAHRTATVCVVVGPSLGLPRSIGRIVRDLEHSVDRPMHPGASASHNRLRTADRDLNSQTSRIPARGPRSPVSKATDIDSYEPAGQDDRRQLTRTTPCRRPCLELGHIAVHLHTYAARFSAPVPSCVTYLEHRWRTLPPMTKRGDAMRAPSDDPDAPRWGARPARPVSSC